MAKTRAKKELTHEKFAKFLDGLNPIQERAGEEYERIRFRLITFFSHRKCRFPEELADETINRVVLKIESEKIDNKIAYCYGVAKFVFMESLRNEKEHENVDDIQLESKEGEKEVDSENPCLDKCLKELPKDNRSLILEYFSESKQAKIDLHKEMSAKLEISKTALRMKVLRVKKKLRSCMEECLAA